MSMSCHMTAYVYRNGQSRNMRRSLFNIYRQTGLGSAEALRTYSQLVYLIKHFFLKLRIKGLGISYAYASAESFFCKVSALFKISPDTYSDNDGRTRI